jgi:hypothetical protein
MGLAIIMLLIMGYLSGAKVVIIFNNSPNILHLFVNIFSVGGYCFA